MYENIFFILFTLLVNLSNCYIRKVNYIIDYIANNYDIYCNFSDTFNT